MKFGESDIADILAIYDTGMKGFLCLIVMTIGNFLSEELTFTRYLHLRTLTKHCHQVLMF